MSADDLDTKPTIETVLERINVLGEQLSKRIDDAVSQLRAEIIGELRAEMRAGFDKVEGQIKVLDKKIDKLALDILEVRAEQGLLEDRVDKLERKPS